MAKDWDSFFLVTADSEPSFVGFNFGEACAERHLKKQLNFKFLFLKIKRTINL